MSKPLTTATVIRELTEFQRWRRGGDGEQPDPKRIGEIIDAAILLLKKPKNHRENIKI